MQDFPNWLKSKKDFKICCTHDFYFTILGTYDFRHVERIAEFW